jgi:hypothetical protein
MIPDHFPKLNIDAVIGFTERLVDYYSEIKFERIVLYRAGINPQIERKVEYVIVFEISPQSIVEFSPHEITIPQVEFVQSMIDGDGGSAFLNESECSELYKNRHPTQHREEWHLIAKTPESGFDFEVTQISEKLLYPFKPSLSSEQETSPKLVAKTKEPVKRRRAAIRKGEMWDVCFDGGRAFLKDLISIRYIWRLLENPNKGITSPQLLSLVSGEQPEVNEDYTKMAKKKNKGDDNDEGNLEKEGLTDNLRDIMGDNLQKHEIERLEKIAYDRWDALRKKELNSEEEWKKTQDYLFNEYGIKVVSIKKELKFKLHKRYKKDAEKARVNVSKNIKNALKYIKKQMPTLHEHLENHIKVGGTCYYKIESSELTLCWHIKWNK